MYRARIGAWVSHRLAQVPGIYKLPAPGIDIFLLRGFLDEEECASLIAVIEGGKQPSQVLADHPDPDYRTSESCNLAASDPLTIRIEAKINALIGIDPRHGETIQGQRYGVGQQFKAHHDFFHIDQPYWPAQEASGGQRTWTAMMFLNQPQAGGQTWFESVDVRISPRAGNLLVWNNLGPDGEPNALSLHRGMPVEQGVKYVITKWYRERPWT